MIFMSKIRFMVLMVVLLVAMFARPVPGYGQTIPDSLPVPIQGYQLISPTEGWVWTDRLYWTKDAGQTWTDITPPNVNDTRLAAVTFVDNQHGAGVLSTITNGAFSHLFTYTSDGGKTWTKQALNLPSGDDTWRRFGYVNSFQFLDANTGWIVLKAMSSSNFDIGALFKTTDGGNTWKQLTMPLSRAMKNPIGDPAWFLTDQIGWVAGRQEGYQPEDNLLYRTSDGGQTWQTQTVGVIPYEDSGLWGRGYQLPQFINTKDGSLIVSISRENITREVYITRDGGLNWKLDSILGGGGPVILLDNTRWIGVVPGKGLMQRTITQMAAPTLLNDEPSVMNIADTDFISPDIGLARTISYDCINSVCTTRMQLLYTNTGGRTWQTLVLPLITQS